MRKVFHLTKEGVEELQKELEMLRIRLNQSLKKLLVEVILPQMTLCVEFRACFLRKIKLIK